LFRYVVAGVHPVASFPDLAGVPALASVPDLISVHAFATIPALTDDQCSAVAGFLSLLRSLLLLRSLALAGVPTVAGYTDFTGVPAVASLLLLASMMLVASLMFPVVVVGIKNLRNYMICLSIHNREEVRDNRWVHKVLFYNIFPLSDSLNYNPGYRLC
jgi:hypothetical protein